MNRHPFWKTMVVLAMTPALLWAMPGAAAEKANFGLTRAVPADVFVCVAARHNPERAFIDAYWQEVLDAVKDAGVESDAMELIGLMLGEGQADEASRLKDRATELLGKVNWSALAGREFVFAERMPDPVGLGGNVNMGPPDILMIFRGEVGTGNANFDGLVAMVEGALAEIGKAAGEQLPALQRSDADGTRMATMDFIQLSADKPAYGMALAQRGDDILVTFGQGMLGQVLSLLSGDGAGSIAATPRFKAAFAQLPPAEDSMVFFDMQRMLDPMRKLMLQVTEQISKAANHATAEGAEAAPSSDQDGGDDGEMWRKVATRLLNVPGMLDYTAAVQYTEGHSVHTKSVAVLVDNAENMPFYPVVGRQAKLTHFDRYLPKETLSFSVGGGFDVQAFYKFIEDTFKTAGAKGEAVWQSWEQMQQGFGCDVRKDVFGWIGTKMLSVTLENGAGTVLMVQVTDDEVAQSKVATAFDFLENRLPELAGQNPALAMMAVRSKPLQNEALPGFHQVYFGMNPPFVWGVADGHLIFADQVDAVLACLKTAKGEHPSIRENERVMAEALTPSGVFSSVSLTDQRKMGQELAAVIGMVSMGSGMVSMMIPDEKPRRIISKMAGMLMKLTPAVNKIDFYKSVASQSTLDGKVWHTHAVTHYKSPEERTAAAQ